MTDYSGPGEPGASIRPEAAISYLRQSGWKEHSHQSGAISIWRTVRDGSRWEVTVPLDSEFDDYSIAMMKVVTTLAEFESVPERRVLDMLQSDGLDVIRVRAVHPRFADGTIPIAEGLALFEATKAMIIAAALSVAANERRPVYRGKRPAEVEEFLSATRLGQTEQGSYVVTVKTQADRLFQRELKLYPDQVEAIPFGRQVTEGLATALEAVKGTIARAYDELDVKPFQETVQDGVSSNLLDAVRSLTLDTKSSEAVVEFGWAPSVPTGRHRSTFIRFLQSEESTLEDASRLLKSMAPEEDYELIGIVTALKNKGQFDPHIVNVLSTERGRGMTVTVQLSKRDYDLAAEAHKQYLPVRCIGQLQKSGRGYQLLSCREFSVVRQDASMNSEDTEGGYSMNSEDTESS